MSRNETDPAMFHVFVMIMSLMWSPPTEARGAHPASMNDVAAIKAGSHDCPHCELAGADLSNTCVKDGNLEGADFAGANLKLMCMSFANFSGATFRHANLAGANLAGSDLDGADFTGADLTITSFKGTDLRAAKGLTQAQLDMACGDADTRAPAGLHVPNCI